MKNGKKGAPPRYDDQYYYEYEDTARNGVEYQQE